ncbi:RNase H domain-containing protein [Trichonephila clavipes]|nr:RNase H domain-containing protein [Trichonephila clavipes]
MRRGDALAKEGAREALTTSKSLTYFELFSARKGIDKRTWLVHLVRTWYRADSPGGSLTLNYDRCNPTAVSRFLSEHLKSLAFQGGHKSHPFCSKCSIEQASPPHILGCLGLSYHDLLGLPIFVYGF